MRAVWRCALTSSEIRPCISVKYEITARALWRTVPSLNDTTTIRPAAINRCKNGKDAPWWKYKTRARSRTREMIVNFGWTRRRNQSARTIPAANSESPFFFSSLIHFFLSVHARSLTKFSTVSPRQKAQPWRRDFSGWNNLPIRRSRGNSASRSSIELSRRSRNEYWYRLAIVVLFGMTQTFFSYDYDFRPTEHLCGQVKNDSFKFIFLLFIYLFFNNIIDNDNIVLSLL